jgi:alpha-tubulin suppressor-like RCC1 family protein
MANDTVVPQDTSTHFLFASFGTKVSFAITEDGECYSWGMVDNGQLGQAQNDEDSWEPQRMVGKQLETRKVIAVSGGGHHTLLIAKEDSPKKLIPNDEEDQLVPEMPMII